MGRVPWRPPLSYRTSPPQGGRLDLVPGPCFRQSPTLEEWRQQAVLPISPLEGEMSGRTEGGLVE
ncbi:ABC transporter ATP-binding protein, partial [Mesorhizobium sp. M7A.F.Ca.CA.002.15.1.1]